MKFVLPTAPDLLRGYFKKSRGMLLGTSRRTNTLTHSYQKTITITPSPQPVTIFYQPQANFKPHRVQQQTSPQIEQSQFQPSPQSTFQPSPQSTLQQRSQSTPRTIFQSSQPTLQPSLRTIFQPSQPTARPTLTRADLKNVLIALLRGVKPPSVVPKHLVSWDTDVRRWMKHVASGFNIRKLFKTAALGISILSLIIGVLLVVPDLYYRFFPADTKPLETLETSSAFGGEYPTEETIPTPTPTPYVPPQDENLPQGDWIIIPRIGIRTELRRTEDPNEALNKGVWWVPDYGEPGDTQIPMIVAAHRFGWQWWWQSDYWKYNSFYKLPELEPGDLVEVISDQRKWTYEIYAGEQGDEITDYEADMILYTCKFLNSPVRYIRYARVIELNIK